MITDNIIEIGIDNKERIYIKPETKHFDLYGEMRQRLVGTTRIKLFIQGRQMTGHILIGIDKLFWRQKENMDVNLF